MSKYYIRFNPAHISNVKYPPWQVIEVIDDIETRRFYVNAVEIDVATWTEKSTVDKDWWNITCEGILVKEDHCIRIVKSL